MSRLNLDYSWTTFDRNGATYAAKIVPDEDHGAPWEEEYGHGPVSEWTTRDKLPGELVLNEDRRAKRFYDFQEACKIARAEGWGFMPWPVKITPDNPARPDYTACGGWAEAGPHRAYDPENFNKAVAAVYAAHRATMTPRQYSAAAAMADYDHLRRWCNDQWHYVGVIVAPVCPCCEEVQEDRAASLWGIESDCGEYLSEVAIDLTSEIEPQEACGA